MATTLADRGSRSRTFAACVAHSGAPRTLSRPQPDIVDKIYAAAVTPALWPDVLDALCALSGATSGALIVLADEGARVVGAKSQAAPEDAQLGATEGWLNFASALPPAAFSSFVALEGHAASHLPHRMRLETPLVTALMLAGDEIVCFAFACQAGDVAPVAAALNAVRAALVRAGVLAAQFSAERAAMTVATLEALGLPAAVLSGAGRVVTANAVSERALFVRLLNGRAVATGGAFALPARDGRHAAIGHVRPLPRDDVFARGTHLLVVHTVRAGRLPPELLSQVFELTAAEAQLASSLMAGLSLAEAGACQKIKVSTARSYLGQIFRKTGTHQQSQLVALLSGARCF